MKSNICVFKSTLLYTCDKRHKSKNENWILDNIVLFHLKHICKNFNRKTKKSGPKKFSFQASSNKLSIQVYYESLCSDSKNFITTQLYPTYQKLGKYLNIDFKPFGNANGRILNTKFKSDSNGGWTFTSRYGNDECLGNNECIGNLYQACLINGLKSDNKMQVEAVNCIMMDDSPTNATQKVRIHIVFYRLSI